MDRSKRRIGDIADINKRMFDYSGVEIIEYLDTGSITENNIDGFQCLDLKKDVIPSRAKVGVSDKTILYSSVRPRLHHYGILEQPKRNCVVSTGFVTIDAKTGMVDPFYLYYLLTSPSVNDRLARIADTATSSYPSINPDDIENLLIEVPENLDVQEKIGRFLHQIDELVKTNSSLISELDSLMGLIFDYWFTQYDFPNNDGNPYRASGGKMVWSQILKRDIPERWEVGTLSYFSSISRKSCTPNDAPEMVFEHYSIPAYDAGFQPAFEKGETIESSKYIVPANSLLISKLNPQFKRLWDPFLYTDNAICSTEFVVVVPNGESVLPFVYSVLDSREYYAYLQNNAICSTGSRSRVEPDSILSYPLSIPPKDLLSSFAKVVAPFLEQKKNALMQNKELTSLRDFLLPMLMNGQVTISE